jgi:RNA polymerase sigma-70 factor, ECF subfamily
MIRLMTAYSFRPIKKLFLYCYRCIKVYLEGYPADTPLFDGVNEVQSRRSSVMVKEDPDLPLVYSLQNGEDQALEALMDRHRESLFRFVFAHVPNEADALELTQEAFVRAYFNIGRFRPTAKFVTWLYHIALNLCRDYSRSRAYHYSLRTISVEESDELKQLAANQRGPDQAMVTHDELIALEKAIAGLPIDLKPALVLTALEGRSYVETAELLGISSKAVGTKVYRARKILLKKLQKFGF